MAERHYVDYEDVTLDGVIMWLREQLLGNAPDALNEIEEIKEEMADE